MSSRLRRDSLMSRIRHAIAEPLDWVDEDVDDADDTYTQARAVERVLVEEAVLDEVTP